ncbi:hypothetical protein [Aeromonas enteropelogenes]|uniref:hypothetical protein n=1 Tax=Aeromonas enteropelogenes TaxID=29489 RepID=UPI003BA1B720
MIDLFSTNLEKNKQHPIFQLISEPEYSAERQVLQSWAEGFVDRDGKFINEFQTTFESSMWELYLFAFLKEIGADIDLEHHAPDFTAKKVEDFCIEATIAAPAIGGEGSVGVNFGLPPEDFSEFNRQSTLRICNSLSSKISKYRKSYFKLEHVKNKPYVIALASFDRPHAHMAANRAIMTALFGVYFDEAATIALGSDELLQMPVDAVVKNEKANVPVGYFNNDEYSDVSAVIYSSVATWGKIRALTKDPKIPASFITLHPNPDSLMPTIKMEMNDNYKEHLLDGLQIYHNPYAKNPLSTKVFHHERLAQHIIHSDGEMEIIAPDDFLLMRMVQSLRVRS